MKRGWYAKEGRFFRVLRVAKGQATILGDDPRWRNGVDLYALPVWAAEDWRRVSWQEVPAEKREATRSALRLGGYPRWRREERGLRV